MIFLFNILFVNNIFRYLKNMKKICVKLILVIFN